MFSVIIPTFERPELLVRCLAQLTPEVQGVPSGSYEVVVTDDGKPGSLQGIRSQFPWVQFITGPRKGPAANRNNGVQHCRGEWIVFTDDDCVPSSTWLAAYASAIEPDIELYEGSTTCQAGVRCFAEDAPINLQGGTFPSCNLMLSRRLFDEIGGFDERFPPYAIMEDIDFSTRLTANRRQWKFVPQAVVDHPPRPRVVGWRAGARWENRVYYDSKWKLRHEFRRWLPLFVLKVRVAEMVKQHRVVDYPQALRSMAGEVWHVARHAGAWERRYRRDGSAGTAS